MRYAIFALIICVAGALPAAADAQAATPRQEAALVAVRGAFPDLKKEQFEVVPDSEGTTEISNFVGERLGVRVRTAAEARMCHGMAGDCGWRPADNTIAIRVQPRSITDDRAVFVIDAWWTSTHRNGTTRESFARQTIVEVARDATGWRFVRARAGMILG